VLAAYTVRGSAVLGGGVRPLYLCGSNNERSREQRSHGRCSSAAAVARRLLVFFGDLAL